MDDIKKKLEEIFTKEKPSELEVKVENISSEIKSIQKEIELLPTIKDDIEDIKQKIDIDIDSIVDTKFKDVVKTIKPKDGKQGKDGKDYVLTGLDKDEIASLIEVPIVEKVIEKTEVIKEVPQEIVGEEIVSKINDLEITPELQIDAKHIKNLPKQSTQFVGGSSGITEIVAGTNITVDNSNPKYPIVSSSGGGGGSGTVTSVDMSVPAGLTISGNPITTSGTLVLGLDIGYVIPLQTTLDGFVPYTGATANVDLGAFDLITNTITSGIATALDISSDTNISVVAPAMQFDASAGSIILRSDGANTGISSNGGSTIAYFDTTSQTLDRTLIIPDADGTIALTSDLASKQDTLVSGTNIKTINGSSILGAGDLSISGVGTGTANTIAYWDTTTSIASLDTATYPLLTELSYVKGVTSAIQTQINTKESALTFSTGLTRATNTITNNLSTGVSGGQSVIGGTAASNALTLSSTSNATKGKIIMGTGFAYHENTQRLSVGGTTDLGFTLGVAGTLAAQQSVYFAQNSGNVTFGSTLNTGQVNFSVKQSTNTGLGWIFGYDSLSTNGFYIYTNETTASPNFNIYTGATQRLTIYGTTSMVLNEAGANFDIRMEGDTNANLFFLDASVDSIGIGHGAPDRLLHVEQADAVTNAVTYPFRVTHTSSGTVATNFGVGQEFEAENASNTNRIIGTHEFIYSDATNATEDATYKLRLIKAGTLTDALTVDSLGNTTFAGVTKTAGYTVATLPAGTVGMRAYVTDALAPAWGVAVAGGGAVVIPVFFDGVVWIVA